MKFVKCDKCPLFRRIKPNDSKEKCALGHRTLDIFLDKYLNRYITVAHENECESIM